MATLDVIQREVEEIVLHFPGTHVIEKNGVFNLIVPSYPLPRTLNRAMSMLLVEVPSSYPNGKPDMFWLDEEVRLNAGSIPKSAEETKDILGDGKIWRRFSWHLEKWDPARDNLVMYLEFIDRRLIQSV